MDHSHPSCERAREALKKSEVTPGGNQLPQGTTSYFQYSTIVRILREFPVKDIFLCTCPRCQMYANPQDGVHNRAVHYDEKELLGEYAAIYGLLIYLRYPSLISAFRRHQVFLDESYLSGEQLLFLDKCNVLEPKNVRKEILDNQHRFQVRQFIVRNVFSEIGEREILPIHDEKLVGEGDFGAVYAFDIPDEYLHESLKVFKTKRFARKIFTQNHSRATAAKEWVNHLYVNKLRHQNLMPALAAFEHSTHFFILFEFAQSTLHELLLSDGNSFTPPQLWKQVHGLASGLAYLHGISVEGEKWADGRMYHMDLKPSNILIVDGIMKIADFGLSRYKPWPTTSGSQLVENSRLEGNGGYAPPPGDVSYEYDIYSFGAMVSEIACFDIGKKKRVCRYRQSRVDDKIEGQQNGTHHFFYREGYETKKSVFTQHRELLENVEFSKRSSTRKNSKLQEWQELFFQQELLDMVETMLHKLEEKRPKAVDVAKKLELFFKRVDDTIKRRRSASEGRLREVDIWEETLDGSVADEPPPKEGDYRFVAHFKGQKCGLWLYPDTQDETLKIRCFLWDIDQDHSKEKEINVDRKQMNIYKGVVPIYRDNNDNPSMGLVNRQLPDPVLYNFRSLSEALLFQGLLTGQHVYRGMNLDLERFSFHKKRCFRTSKETPFNEPALLQMWTNRIIRDDEYPEMLNAKIAIIIAKRLHIIEVTNHFVQNHPRLKKVTLSPNVIRLANIKTYSIDITNGIPLMLDKTQEYRKYDEAWFFLRNKKDTTIFWSSLNYLQTE